jgi:hypothetical protein
VNLLTPKRVSYPAKGIEQFFGDFFEQFLRVSQSQGTLFADGITERAGCRGGNGVIFFDNRRPNLLHLDAGKWF